MKLKEFTQLVEKETSLIAFLDLTNMFHWQGTLKWQFSVYEIIKQLLAVKTIKEVRIYYGLNERELKKSENFHRRLREQGAILITKPVKWIKKQIKKDLFVTPITQRKLDKNAHKKLDELIDYLQTQMFIIEEPKCNFDVEMALDILDVVDNISGIFLFSGDSDLREPLKRLKLKGRRIYLFGVRGQVAGELMQICTGYIDFGKWYQGSKKRKSHS